ncbi:MAG: hypothetical protein JSS65_14705 [Armatimonadetes bacterium]|nr:hypothetical protein [Armatimonadota bacterium]
MKRFFLDRRAWVASLVVVLALCAVFGGWRGASGFGLGVVGTGVNMVGLKAATKAMTLGKTGGWLATVVFLAKWPVFIVCAWACWRLGGPGPGCFLAGVGLVYCLVVGWAAASA